MPTNVRNFWIEIEVDGKTTKIATGPQSKDGGFTMTIKQRQDGEIIQPLTIEGIADEKQLLHLRVTRHLPVAKPATTYTEEIRNGFEVVTKR